MKKIIISIWLFIVSGVGLTQVSDSAINKINQLEQVDIFARKDFGLNSNRFDSINTNLNYGYSLAEALRFSGVAYMKQLAPGQLSTISMKGGNASQTQVIWQGVNLNNIATGQTDFSMIPMCFFSGVEVESGAVSAANGNGVSAGAIKLFNTLNANHIGLFSQIGSYNQHFYGIDFSKKMKKFGFSLKPFYTSSLNNYAFLSADNIQKELTNANYKGAGVMFNSKYDGIRSVIYLDVWTQFFNRNIPVAEFGINNHANQLDKNCKTVLNYEHKLHSWFKITRIAWLFDELIYSDDYTPDNDKLNLNTFLAESESVFQLQKNLISFKASSVFAVANNTGYNDLHFLNRNALTVHLSHENRTMKKSKLFSISLREESNNSLLSVPITQIGYSLEQLFSKNILGYLISFRANINSGTVYRFPTMNDLYWKYGGNNNLKPEYGFAGEFGGTILFKGEKKIINQVFFGSSHFEKYIFDWIVWYPSGQFWSPQNLMEVWSRGADSYCGFVIGKKVIWKNDAHLFYTLSTLQKSDFTTSNAVGKQLLYVPMYNWVGNSSITIKYFTLNWHTSYYGYRYTSTDNYEYLNPFFLHSVSLMFSLHSKFANYNLNFTIDNLLNENYKWMAARPAMPRNYVLSIKINLNK